MVQILIVEDDVNIAKMIAMTLSLKNYQSVICHDGKEAVDLIFENHYDLILLDIMLPGMDGFEVIQRIQKRKIPVIFLSALQDVTDKVKGLYLGAEDYIAKPFEAMELLARVEVVLRRNHKEDNVLLYKNIVVDVDKHVVTKDGQEVSLTFKEFDVFVCFLRNIDIALTRERLLAQVWGYEFEGETRTVDVHVQQLRRKLDLHKDLITVSKVGYRLESRD